MKRFYAVDHSLDLGDIGRVPITFKGLVAEVQPFGRRLVKVEGVFAHLPGCASPINITPILSPSARVDLEEKLEQVFEAEEAHPPDDDGWRDGA